MKLQKLRLAAPFLLSAALLMAQGRGVGPTELLKPLKDAWPTYNGDYSGKRYSALTQIDRSTVKHLTLAWTIRVTPGPGNPGAAAGRFGRGGGGAAAPIIVGGEGTGDFAAGGGTVKGSVAERCGGLYFTNPDKSWAVEARDRRALWL